MHIIAKRFRLPLAEANVCTLHLVRRWYLSRNLLPKVGPERCFFLHVPPSTPCLSLVAMRPTNYPCHCSREYLSVSLYVCTRVLGRLAIAILHSVCPGSPLQNSAMPSLTLFRFSPERGPLARVDSVPVLSHSVAHRLVSTQPALFFCASFVLRSTSSPQFIPIIHCR